MEINKSIKLKKITGDQIYGKETFYWEYKDYMFEYVNGDSRVDIMTPEKNWETHKLNGKFNRTTAIKTIKQILTLKGVE